MKWMDTREVGLCSTIHSAGLQQARGGVDVSDALIGSYTVHNKSMKWYKRFLTTSWTSPSFVQGALHGPPRPCTHPKTVQGVACCRDVAPPLIPPPGSTPQPLVPPRRKGACLPRYYGTNATQMRHCRRCKEGEDLPLCITAKKPKQF